MIPFVPGYVNAIFMLTVLATLVTFFSVIRKSNQNPYLILIILISWLALQGILAFQGFYFDSTTFPPKFLLATIPPLLTIILLFVTKSGLEFIDTLPISILTFLNIMRIPVELVLYWLFLYKAVPELMTFEGRNFDIFAGVTAPFVGYLVLTGKIKYIRFLLIWNCICLGLLLNIIIYAVLSAPFTFQKFGFDQPNIAVMYYPFIWLPSFIVPIILFGHLVSIRKILKVNKEIKNNPRIDFKHSYGKEISL